MSFLLNLLRIRRVEFRIAELPIFLIPVLLTIRTSAPLRTTTFWEGVVLFFFLFAFGDIINCLADRDLDATYKPHLSNAVYSLGVRFVAFQVAVSALAALALTLHIAWRLDRPLLPVLVVAGLALGAAYSVEPVRLKSRGLAQIPCLWLILFVGPMLLAILLVSPTFPLAVVAYALAYGCLQMGVILVNTAEDYPEDLAAGVRTSIIALGLPRSLALAFGLSLVGGLASLTILCSLYAQRHAPPAAWTALLLPFAACVFVAAGIGRLARSVARADLTEGIVLVKRAAKIVPIWITLVAWSSCAAAFALYRLAPRLPQ